ncbi:MAG: substrate-binding domain-containing protein [Bryobacterales bacterium]|nr:substrate-binding domain-containing protein [Bryobacterales bacterium]
MKKSREIGKPTGAGTLDKGLTVLETIEHASHPVTLQEIAAASGIQRLAVYRLASVLVERGYVRRGEDKRYRAATRRRRPLLGYAAPLTGNTFRQDLAASLQRAADAADADLVMLHNDPTDSVALMQNVETLLKTRVNLTMLFQPVEALGNMVAGRLAEASVPFISIERPVQGGVYFGANNYQAGKLAGRRLGRHAQERWGSRYDRVVLIEGAQTSTNVNARLAGVLVGLGEVAGAVDIARVVHLHGNADREASRLAMATLFERLPEKCRMLVSAFNDISALGAMDAVLAAGRSATVAIVGHNAMHESRVEIRKSESPFIASVAYFPERYGPKLLKLATSIIEGDATPPAAYTDHLVIDQSNVDALYPMPAS